ncbi:MAG TPA: ATP-binding protein [Ktedonobacterales bacterium]|nr:ATP-binding protein [Ktedonobacterales bacterium]
MMTHSSRRNKRPLTTATATAASWRQQVAALLYLIAALPLGLVYFVFLVVGVSLGVSTLVIWIGIVFLVGTLFAWWQLARFERWLALHWLHADVAPLLLPPTSRPLSRRHIMERLRDPLTWKTLAFLLLKFPCGLLFFVATVTLLSVSLVAAIVSIVIGLLTGPFVALGLLMIGAPAPQRRVRHYLVFAATGFGIGLVAFFLIDQMARLARFLAVRLLGASEEARRLHDMALQVAREHERAAQADQRRRQLIVDLSHELRTPIASIAAHLESLEILTEEGAPAPAPATVSHYAHVADQEVRRLATLVDELLALARMESDELRLNIQSVAAGEVIEDVYQALAPLAARERNILLVRGADRRLPPVLADRQRLTQILTNLVRNAIAYTPAGGLVSLSLESADADQLAIVVADNGVGIPQDDQDRIFERFYRVDRAQVRAPGGLGLGLPIVQSLVAAMGGTLRLESKEGEGSRFSVLLRRAPVAAAPVAAAPVATPEATE